jgi:hypothetical protein
MFAKQRRGACEHAIGRANGHTSPWRPRPETPEAARAPAHNPSVRGQPFGSTRFSVAFEIAFQP